MLSAEVPVEAAGGNVFCRQVCEGGKDEGPSFGLRGRGEEKNLIRGRWRRWRSGEEM